MSCRFSYRLWKSFQDSLNPAVIGNESSMVSFGSRVELYNTEAETAYAARPRGCLEVSRSLVSSLGLAYNGTPES